MTAALHGRRGPVRPRPSEPSWKGPVGQRVRYVAADLQPVMLQRTRAEANRRDLDQIELVSRPTSRRRRSKTPRLSSASATPACTASPTQRRRSREDRARPAPAKASMPQTGIAVSFGEVRR